MATDARGHTVPASTDHPSRATLLNLSLSIRDINVVANTTARATLISTLTSAGQGPSTTNPVIVYRADARADSCLEITTDGTVWRAVPLTGDLQTYTPALTASTTAPTLGTGSSSAGQYQTQGQWVNFEADVIFGTSGVVAGSGNYEIQLPVAAQAGAPTTGFAAGSGEFFDSSGGKFYPLHLRFQTTTTLRLIEGTTGTYLSNTNPVVPAASDRIHVSGGYFAA